jgi:hypothetical protein
LIGKIKNFLFKIFVYSFFYILGKTARIKIIGKENYENLRKKKKPFIFIVWHGRMFLPVFLHRNEGIRPLISLSQDGEIASQIVRLLGYRPIRGSSSRGGKGALKEMCDELENYAELAIIPDGPRGPRRVLKPGCIYIAQKTGAYLVPISFSCSRKIFLNSWDRFLLFPPFTKCVVLYGKPIEIKKDLNKEELENERKRVEEILIDLDSKADNYFN